MRYVVFALLCIFIDCGNCSTTHGSASWYGNSQPTASGERFSGNELTAAHRSLPFNTIVLVTNKKNGKTVTVRINDRGPYARATKKTKNKEVAKIGRNKYRTIQSDRIIDLSRKAAKEIGMINCGIVPVKIEVLGKNNKDEFTHSLYQGGEVKLFLAENKNN